MRLAAPLILHNACNSRFTLNSQKITKCPRGIEGEHVFSVMKSPKYTQFMHDLYPGENGILVNPPHKAGLKLVMHPRPGGNSRNSVQHPGYFHLGRDYKKPPFDASGNQIIFFRLSLDSRLLSLCNFFFFVLRLLKSFFVFCAVLLLCFIPSS